MTHNPPFFATLLVFSMLCSCGKEDDGRKQTYAVTGQVLVDGEPPDSPIAVKCHPVGGMDETNPTISSAFTGDDGRFEISTYESGDGIPEGEYILTFYWGKRNLISNSYGGPDKLKGKYKDPKKSPIKVEVNGEEQDLGQIELKTK